MVWTGLGWDEAFQKEDIIFVDRLGGERVEVPIPNVLDDRKETRIPKAGMPVRNPKDEVVGRGNLASHFFANGVNSIKLTRGTRNRWEFAFS